MSKLKISFQEIGNLTEWIIQSTEYRPVKPDSCDIRDELDSNQKVMVIVMIWTFFIIVSIFYCYFCEQKLFPGQKLFDTCLVDRYYVWCCQYGVITGKTTFDFPEPGFLMTVAVLIKIVT